MKAVLAAAATIVLGTTVLGQSSAQKPAQTPAVARAAATAGLSRSIERGDRIFGLTKLHKIRLTVSAAEWAVLQTSGVRGAAATGGSDYVSADGRLIHAGSGFSGQFPWVRADLRVDNPDFKAEFRDVGLRYKGNSSFSRSSAAAPLFANFKLKIDVHGTKGAWDGEKTFNLHAGVIDTSKMKDAIAFAIFRGAGVPAPRTAFAEVVFTVPGVYNDVSAGTFTIIEDVNQRFLERVLPPGTGLLMKPEGMRGGIQYRGDTWASYMPNIRPDRDPTPHEQQRFIEFAQLISQPDVELFRNRIGTYLDVDQFLRFVAVHLLIVNTDSYIGGGHNYYLYLDPSDDKFRFIPWDQDLSMAGRGMAMGEVQVIARPPVDGTVGPPVRTVIVGPSITQQMDVMRPFNRDQPLIAGLMDDPAVAARYRAILRELSERVFTAAELLPMIDALEKVGTGRGPSPRPFIESRTAYLQQVVAAWGGK